MGENTSYDTGYLDGYWAGFRDGYKAAESSHVVEAIEDWHGKVSGGR